MSMTEVALLASSTTLCTAKEELFPTSLLRTFTVSYPRLGRSLR